MVSVSKEDLQRLCILQAIYKAVAQHVSTKDPDNLRGIVDGQLKDFYDETGSKTLDLHVCDTKVGTISLRFSKEIPASTKIVIDDMDAFDAWACHEDLAREEILMTYREGTAEATAERYFRETGEVPDGTRACPVPVTPAVVSGTTLKVDHEKVHEALASRGELESTIKGLLTYGGEF